MSEKDGNELLDEAAAEPLMDEAMRRDPKDVSPEMLEDLIHGLRAKRAKFIQKEAEKEK